MAVGEVEESGRRSTRKLHAAVVYNPTKVDLRKLRPIVNKAESHAKWARTRWLETTASDAGGSMARDALDNGAALILAVGGDGTVRAVAEAMRGSGVPLGLIPAGTGNLLARNLELSVTNMYAAVEVAFTGQDRAIDLGIAEISRGNDSTQSHAFLVMAGLGLDARMIAKTNPKLKKAVGWLAYVDAGRRALPELEPVKLRYRLDDGAERALTAHTLIVGNCGSLPGGILLLPEAELDDGILDIAALKPRGRFGWLRVWRKITWENGVLRKSAAGRKIIDLTADVRDVAYFRGTRLRVELEKPEEFQLDGDEFGTVTGIECYIDAGALTVRVPA